jgi:acyl dehydratase
MASMPVERGKIREYALATANARPEFLEDPAAPIPPTFLSTVVFWESLLDVLDEPAAVEAFREVGVSPDVSRLLSVEQEYVFHGVLPRAGETLTTALRFDGVQRKIGRAGGAMLFVRFAVEFSSGSGDLRAECLYTSAYRVDPLGDGMAMSAPTPAAVADSTPAVLHELPSRRFGPITMTDIVRYQGASGDLNPMHHDDELARSAGYPAAFSVGMLSAGYLATFCTDTLGTESVRRFRTRFKELVWRGDALTACGRIVRTVENSGEPRVGVDLRLLNGSGTAVVEGYAEFICEPTDGAA